MLVSNCLYIGEKIMPNSQIYVGCCFFFFLFASIPMRFKICTEQQDHTKTPCTFLSCLRYEEYFSPVGITPLQCW